MTLPRFYPILDCATAQRRGLETWDIAKQILDAGARILQFRHKGLASREIFAEMERVADACRAAGALFVVNDRVDLATMLGAAVHLGQTDLAPVDARVVTGGETIIGFSTHNERQFRDAAKQPVDYMAFGPIFATGSKANPDPVVGLDELRRLRALTMRPVVAIGGITRGNAGSVIEAGADSVAVIGDLFPADGEVRGRVEEWIRILNSDS